MLFFKFFDEKTKVFGENTLLSKDFPIKNLQGFRKAPQLQVDLTSRLMRAGKTPTRHIQVPNDQGNRFLRSRRSQNNYLSTKLDCKVSTYVYGTEITQSWATRLLKRDVQPPRHLCNPHEWTWTLSEGQLKAHQTPSEACNHRRWLRIDPVASRTL